MGLAPTAPRPSPVAPAAAIDIGATADRTVVLLRSGKVVEAVQMVETARQGQLPIVQDALDRLVSARSRLCFRAPDGSGADISTALARINTSSMTVPTMPVLTQMAVLSEQQQHDIYSAIAETRGTQDVIDALQRGDRVIVGLRAEASTLINRGQGNSYADRIVVLWRHQATRRIEVFTAANTQPTAQYDGNQRTNKAIIFRRADGQDVTQDGIPELGRLSEGTYAMRATTHHNPRTAGTNFSLRPTDAAVTAGTGRVERDSNHDGQFDSSDPNRLSDLNNTFKIHSGSRANTDSAGCQTIAPGDFRRFETAVNAGGQSVWQYLLVRVTP